MGALCDVCNGSGEGYADGTRCQICKGRGLFDATCRECGCDLTEREEQYLETLCESCSGECLCHCCVESR